MPDDLTDDEWTKAFIYLQCRAKFKGGLRVLEADDGTYTVSDTEGCIATGESPEKAIYNAMNAEIDGFTVKTIKDSGK